MRAHRLRKIQTSLHARKQAQRVNSELRETGIASDNGSKEAKRRGILESRKNERLVVSVRDTVLRRNNHADHPRGDLPRFIAVYSKEISVGQGSEIEGERMERGKRGGYRRERGWRCLLVDVQLFIQRPHPKVLGITRRHGPKQGGRIGVESRVLSLINKARGLELPPFFPSSPTLAGNCRHPYCFRPLPLSLAPILSPSYSAAPFRSPLFVHLSSSFYRVRCAQPPLRPIRYLSQS